MSITYHVNTVKQMSICSTLDPLNAQQTAVQTVASQLSESRRSLSIAHVRRESTFGSFNQSPSFLSIQRPRVNSVFVTPPTRPVTPALARNGAYTSAAELTTSPPRRYKSAEDLRHIVNSFTRRKSTFLMSPNVR